MGVPDTGAATSSGRLQELDPRIADPAGPAHFGLARSPSTRGSIAVDIDQCEVCRLLSRSDFAGL